MVNTDSVATHWGTKIPSNLTKGAREIIKQVEHFLCTEQTWFDPRNPYGPLGPPGVGPEHYWGVTRKSDNPKINRPKNP